MVRSETIEHFIHYPSDMSTGVQVILLKELLEFRNGFEDKKSDTVLPKPPLGVKPKFIHDQERLEELSKAIERFHAANVVIPADIMFEYLSLNHHLSFEGKDPIRESFTAPEKEKKLVTKKAIQIDEQIDGNVDFQRGFRVYHYKFPICALDIQPPTYKIKE